MKTRYILTSLVLASTLIFSSCKDDNVSNEPIDRDTEVHTLPAPVPALIEVTQGETTASSCELTFTPKDSQTKYISLVMPRVTFNVTKPEDLSSKALEQLKDEAQAEGKSLGEYLSSIEATGEVKKTVSGLMSNTVYSVVTFERDGETLKNTQLNDRFYFSTKIADKVNLTFETTTEVDGLLTKLTVVPNDKEVGYYVFNFTKAQYDKLKEQNFTDEQILFEYFKNNLYRMLSVGSEEEMQAAREKLLYKGDRSFQIQAEAEDTEYVYMMASFVAIDPFTIAINSDVHKGSFISGKSKILPYTFNIEVFDVTETHFDVRITPSDDKVVYAWRQGDFTDELKAKTPDQIADDIIKAPFFGGPWDRKMGVVEHAKISIDNPGTPHYVIVFGFQGKTRVTKAALYTFDTGTPADPASVTFETENRSITPYTANIKFTPSDLRVYFAMSLIKDGKTNTQEQKDIFQEQLKEGFKGFKEANPTLDESRYIDTYYFKGETYYEFPDLEPETSYTLYTYTISQSDATVVNVEERKSYLTTPAISEAKVTPELFGIFDANDIDESVIKDIEQARGSAIVVVKYNFSDDAVEGRGYLVPKTFREVELNPELISDKTIQSTLKPYFAKLENKKGGNRYGYYTCVWGEEQVSLTYAIDANGGTGHVMRKVIANPIKENVSDVSKLNELVKKIEAEKSSASGSSRSARKYVSVDFRASSVDVIAKKSPKSISSLPGKGVFRKNENKKTFSPEVKSELKFPLFTVVR